MSESRTHRVVRWIEIGLVAVGVTCLTWTGTSWLAASVYQAEYRTAFAESVQSLDGLRTERPPGADASIPMASTATDGQAHEPGPIGRLEIPRIGLSAVVAEGDDEKTLRIAVGHLPDTPLPWQEGNSAFAGHRDSFFRPLRRIHVGDVIHLATHRGTFQYRVTRHHIVDPDELWVLDPSPTAALTLITCYPFDFVGPAPQRFVVQAERVAAVNEGREADLG